MQAADHSLSTLSCESAFFISDLHLSDQTPQLIARFEHCCESINSQWLIVMGDLFEGYCGDDDHSASIASVERAFIKLHNRGVRVGLMHGNRDFMMGQDFAMRCQAQMLHDPCVLNGDVLMAHGDAWCTLDTAYQAWRSTCRQPQWQAGFLAQALSQRQAQVKAYRGQLKNTPMDMSSSTTDVVDDEVLRSAAQMNCQIVIHGHTHRPSDRWLQGESANKVRKLVLGDWEEGNQDGVTCVRLDNGALASFLI
jgi:UDP-2,3-diacylglucosamine hydrolase